MISSSFFPSFFFAFESLFRLFSIASLYQECTVYVQCLCVQHYRTRSALSDEDEKKVSYERMKRYQKIATELFVPGLAPRLELEAPGFVELEVRGVSMYGFTDFHAS